MIIAYFGQGYPGESLDLRQFVSQAQLRRGFREFAEAAGRAEPDAANATVFLDRSDADWKEALRFARDGRAYGIPFDYPDQLLAVGPRGGVKVETT